jgi:molybdopterin molybdotransferase
MYPLMIDVAEAEAIILSNSLKLPIESVPLSKVWNRVLAEDLFADRDFPPFNRVTMDGIAINYQAFENGQRSFVVAAVQAAGKPPLQLFKKDQCMEVMTGAMLPAGTDTVIRYEDLLIENGVATIQIEAVKAGQNVHLRGSDRKKGELLLSRGKYIGAAETASLATIGKTQIKVVKLPKVMLSSSGDELVEVDEKPLPYQIRRSNVYAMTSLLMPFRIVSAADHLPDEKEIMRKFLKENLGYFNVLVISGAVSEGKFDFVPEVLEELGVKKLFHKVAQRPGKPFWFGRQGSNGPVVFALPGNPVSAFACTCRYVLPFLRKSLGLEPIPQVSARLATDVTFKPDLTYFLQVKTHFQDGVLMAEPLVGNGSGDLASLNDADGFLELPRGRETFLAGEVFPLYPYR